MKVSGGEVSNLPVSASTPPSVMSSVCSNCADRLPSVVAAVHLSWNTRVHHHSIYDGSGGGDMSSKSWTSRGGFVWAVKALRCTDRPEDVLVAALADHGLDGEGVARLHYPRRLVVPAASAHHTQPHSKGGPAVTLASP
jgi:hypothetical protein